MSQDESGNPAEPTDERATPAAPAGLIGRRSFLNTFSREAVISAMHLAQVANGLRTTIATEIDAVASGTTAVETLLDPQKDLEVRLSQTTSPESLRIPRVAPFRVEDESVVVLDQAVFPSQLIEHRCTNVEDVVDAIRRRHAYGTQTATVLAAYGTWLAARSTRSQEPAHTAITLRNAANALRLARPDLPAIGWALARCARAWGSLDPGDRDELVRATRQAADDIAFDITQDLARLARQSASLFAKPTGRALQILTLDSIGSLTGGRAGTVAGVIGDAASRGRQVHVWVLETRPGTSGSRLAAWDLARAGIPHSVIVDGAAAALLESREIDAVIVTGDRIAKSGMTTGVLGTYGLAQLARAHGVPFYVAALLITVDCSVDGDQGLRADLPQIRGGSADDAWAIGRTSDETPPELIEGFLTEMGLISAPYRQSLVAAAAKTQLFQ